MRSRLTSRLISVALCAAVALLASCETDSGTEIPPDEFCSGGKCDALNPQTDPANLGFTIKYELADETMIGVPLRSELIPYDPPTYWPFTSDGINKRTYGEQGSPAEKYDQAFSGWTPPEGFWDLDRIDSTSDRTFDQAYYDALGPVATWEHQEHGLGRLHDGVDNDGDEKIDFEDDNNEGLESWFGYCNGNTSASLSVPEPLHDVTYNEVVFRPYDIMALLAAVHYDDRSTMTGLRCESLKPVKDEYGRLVNQPWYRTPGETAMTFFTILQGPVWFDETQQWVAYLIQPEGSTERGIIRLSYEEFRKWREEIKAGSVTTDQRTWSDIEFSTVGTGCRDTNPASIYLAVTNILGKNKIPFGIDADAGSHVWNYPIYQATINEQRMVDKSEANTLLGVDAGSDYLFNDDAVNFAYVKLTLQESHSMTLEMILELDAENKVIGGEWVGGSKTSHPDFIWMAMGADTTGFNTEGTYMTFGDDQMDGRERSTGEMDYTDAPGMTYSNVRKLLAASRTGADDAFSEFAGQGGTLTLGSTTSLTVSVEAAEGAVVKEALLYMDAQADFVPGLKIELVAPDGTSVKIFDLPLSTSDWQPGRFPTGWDLKMLRGVAHPMPLLDENGDAYLGLKAFAGKAASGEWTLKVNNAQGGAATLSSWSLWLVTGPAA